MSAVAGLDDVTKVYRVRGQGAHHVAVDRVSFSVEAGETVGIVGESGSGKTTIARMLLRLTRPTSGRVSIGGMDIWSADRTQRKQLPRAVQVVFQDPYASLDPRMTVGASIAEGAKRVSGASTPPVNWGACSISSGSRNATGTCTRDNYREDNVNGWRSRGRWPCNQPSWWPTNRSAPSTSPCRDRCSTCSTSYAGSCT